MSERIKVLLAHAAIISGLGLFLDADQFTREPIYRLLYGVPRVVSGVTYFWIDRRPDDHPQPGGPPTASVPRSKEHGKRVDYPH